MKTILSSSWLTFPVMESVNTRIGWPGLYWEAGFLPFAGYLLVLLIIYVSLKVLLDETTPPAISFAMLVVAACMLQYLPESTNGFQFVPCFPWLYFGFVAVTISVLAWLATGFTLLGFYIGVQSLGFYNGLKDKDPGFFLIIGLVLNGLLSFWQIDIGTETSIAMDATKATPATISPSLTDSEITPHTETAELGERIVEWNKRRSKLGKLLTKLEEDRLNLLRQLDQKRVKSLGEASSDPRAKVHLDELREVLKQRVVIQKKYDEFDLAILKCESRLRTIERRLAANDAGVDDAELKELTRTMIKLDESLTTENETEVPIELDTLLEQQLNPDHLHRRTRQ